ncbi:OCIA domain-containing protein 1-like isoform X1 [Biomphalaria glabrata]|uniref:OCIA domain-containing protein 1-like isoform X1 n=2 Tax=Biomphalaria glabrata TaxID=6526 RepID=A0A9U8E2G6_BIOGL|nr:OCIA domain-containing protein 1-like isoform X1 [Biomphalaria glabrata]
MASDLNNTPSFTDRPLAMQNTNATAERPRTNPLATITEEERRVLKECERDSFFLRAAPLSFGAMAGAYYMVKTGKWTPHPKFGAIPKMIITGGFGYFTGKLSYLPTCQKKILEQIPNSNLAAAIRKSRGLSSPDGETFNPALDDSLSRGSSNQIEEYRPAEGIDDRFRPSMDREVKEPSVNQEKNTVTYDDLRRKNRQEYEESLSKRNKSAPPASAPYKDSPFIPERHLPESRDLPKTEFDGSVEPSQAPPKRKRTTIWGDVIEE